MTFVIVVIMLAYASIKMIQLYDKQNPNVSQFIKKNDLDFNDRLNLNEIGFRLAWSVEGYNSLVRKDDPRYVKYLVRLFRKENGKPYEQFIPYHDCTEEDWAQFAPVQKASLDSWTAIKNDPKRNMFCLEWSDDIQVYGNEKNDFHQRIEIVLVPCNYQHVELGDVGDTIHPECVEDLQKQIEYLGPINFMIYHTEDVFQQEEYGERAVVSQSILLN